MQIEIVRRWFWQFSLCMAVLGLFAGPRAVAQNDPSFPHIAKENGRYALMVDGAPYLILGAQVNNSSGWPVMLPKVWPAMEMMHVNTVEIPVYWEQLEPRQGVFDYSVVDTLLAQAREHQLHLVLLWFGTWKNGSNHYMPSWMKLDPDRYPNIIGADGKYIDSPSPLAPQTLAADIKAFSSLMRHLKQADTQHTVLMVQVENEPGTWGGVRDFSPAAQKLFNAPAPVEVLTAMQKTKVAPSANWRAAFGDDADEYFHAWCISKYIGQVAAAGKAIYPLPLYVNAALRDPIDPGRPPRYEGGGATDNVIPIWKAEAPAVDLLAPDIYQRDTLRYLKVLDDYARPDNALFVPETIGQGMYARFLFAALGHGTIGFSPFGLDYTRSFDPSPLANASPDQVFAPTTLNYELIGPMSRQIARLNFEGKLQTAVDQSNSAELSGATGREDPSPPRALHFSNWDAEVGYGLARRVGPATRPLIPPQPNGRALIAQLGENQFLVTGLYCHVHFHPAGAWADKPWQYLSVEEGHYEESVFKSSRILNGDQTDWGLIFSSSPMVLRVTLYTR